MLNVDSFSIATVLVGAGTCGWLIRRRIFVKIKRVNEVLYREILANCPESWIERHGVGRLSDAGIDWRLHKAIYKRSDPEVIGKMVWIVYLILTWITLISFVLVWPIKIMEIVK